MEIISSNDFDQEINNGYVLVDFFANWCGPCKMLGPVLEEASKEYPNIKFIKVDTDESSDIAMRYSIMSIPVIMLFKDGVQIAKSIGYQPLKNIEKFINENIK